jgi:hypothetical protein
VGRARGDALRQLPLVKLSLSHEAKNQNELPLYGICCGGICQVPAVPPTCTPPHRRQSDNRASNRGQLTDWPAELPLPSPPLMTYLDYINLFWRKDREFFFTPEEVAIYFRLLNHANNIGWKEQFNISLDRLMMEVGIKSRRPFDTARQRLREAALLDFKNGNGRGCTTEYTLLTAETTPKRPPETSRKRGVKNTPLSATLSATNTQGLREENVAVHKTKIKTKKKESNDSLRASKKASSSSPVESSPAEPWASWLVQNTPTVQRLKSPLTAEQWVKLVADFTEPLVQEVLLAMENKADLLKKYTSANLTAREWCSRRHPQRSTPLAPVQSAVAPESLKADLNDDVINERKARQEADLAAERRRKRESQTALTSS